ncbi:DnaD domain protein [Staphylococcus aureus]|nr:DnaD domain protein [Staphylococcus aureus]MBH4649562.1 DnaD domain protein [Staphylococcus aureus]MBH4654841.1 DnaD domain protein [Staphylococcus aureus]MBH4657387.1 DnaD domain protein [Staphylococcus aureus]MBH4662208.1 DnaD domain protein [Staphylococcus aureus]
MAGWIKIHRKIIDHWIWTDSKRLKWWMDLLLLTNHSDKKVMLGGKLVVLKRGSFHTSELKLSERWNVSRNTVRNYLNALEKDTMITTKKTKNGTTIIVHNYGIYQDNDDYKKQQTEQLSEQQSEQQSEQKNEQQSEQKNEQQTEQKNEQQTEQKNEQQTEQKNEQQSEQKNEQQSEQKKDNRLNRTLNKTKELKNIKNDKNVKNMKKEKKNYKVFDFFQENGFGFITQYILEDINYYLDAFCQDSDEILIAALKIAKDRNKVNWGYAKSILNSWLQMNLSNYDQIKAYEAQYKATKKMQNKQKESYKSKEKTPSWLTNQNQNTAVEVDEEFEKDRAEFLKKLNAHWGD